MTMITRDIIIETLSDLSKEAHGFRMRLDFESMTDEELKSCYDRFFEAAREARDAECLFHLNAQRSWEIDLAHHIVRGAKCRRTAIRWDMEAFDIANEDVSAYVHERGLAYELKAQIRETLR